MRRLLPALVAVALALGGCQAADRTPPAVVGLDLDPVARTSPATVTGPLSGLTIVVDPGHAGVYDKERSGELITTNGLRVPCYTSGATAPDGTGEHSLNFDLARRTAAALRALGAATTFTRVDDTTFGPCNDRRATLANQARADALVSLHADSDAAGKRGFHIIYAPQMAGGRTVEEASKGLAEAVASGLRATPIRPANYKGTPEMPIDPRANIAALNGLTATPGVLVEVGNLNNPDDWSALRQPATRDAVATAIADGVRVGLRR